MLIARLMILVLLVFGLAPPASSQNIEKARLNPEIQEAEKLHQAGYDFFIAREYRMALESFIRELPLRRAASDTPGEAWALNQIGECHLSLDEYQRALNSYKQALPLRLQRTGISLPLIGNSPHDVAAEAGRSAAKFILRYIEECNLGLWSL